MKKLKKITEIVYKNGNIIGNNDFFEISFEYQDFNEGQIKKTYQEIRNLYKTLILKCPGCLITRIESKTLLMKINISTIKNFLECFIDHPTLSENISVIEFFSNQNENENSKSDKALNIEKMKTMIEADNDEEDFEMSKNLSEEDKISKSDNIISNKNKSENFLDEFEIIEKEDCKDFIDKDGETELLNLYIEENNKKGFFKKAKDFASSWFNYIRSNSYKDDNFENNYTNSLNNNYQEKDLEYIKSNYSELGEDIEINNYKKEVLRIKEGLKDLINNFQKEDGKEDGIIKISEQKMNSLEDIIKIFKEVQNLENSNNNEDENNKNEEDIESNNKEKFDNKLLNGHINKLEEYASINKKFIKDKLCPIINELINIKEIFEGIEDIYSRKDNHIIFLVKLHCKLNEKIKESELLEDSNNKKMKINEINSFKKKVEREKNFIHKLNQDLKYEIDKLRKTKENNIYELINRLYSYNYIKECEINEIFNKEIFLDSDSENSSKIKMNSEISDDKNEIKNDNNNNSWDEI